MSSDQTTTPLSSPSKSDRDATVEAVNHLIQGKRHMLVRDISSAVNSLQEACRILAACYGEVADECGDAYFHYGSALLELSRKESGILGNEKVGSGSEEEESEEENEDDDNDDEEEEESGDDDEEEKSSEKVDRATAKETAKEECEMGGTVETDGEMAKAGAIVDKVETKSKPSKEESKTNLTKDDSEAKSEDLDVSKKADENTDPDKTIDTPVSDSGNETKTAVTVNKDVPDTSACAKVSTTDGATAGTSAGTSTSVDSSQPGTSKDQPPGEEDEVTTLQLSWEILELSKVIFKRQSENSREMQLRLAQVHLKLGEVAMESENYKQSIEDLMECFKIQHTLLPADDRAIAEVYYQLGLAYTFDLQFDLAIESFKNAVQTIRDKISNVQKVADGTGTSVEEIEAAYNAKKEIEELNELVPEILEKITDTEYLKKHDLKLPEELNKDLVPEQFKEEIAAVESTACTTISPSKIPKPVSSIAHLVRKKRKPEEDVNNSVCDSMESKRPRSCIEELSSGSSANDPSSIGNISNGTSQMDCNQIGDTSKSTEQSIT